MSIAAWYIVIGCLLVALAFAGSRLKHLPLTTAMLYLPLGAFLGAAGFLEVNALRHSLLLERLTEIAVIVSLFATGLKLPLPLGSRLWRLPVLLASASMAMTVALIAVLGWLLLDLPPGTAIILGAVLAPTDPVLASDIQVETPNDTDKVRFTLTGEAGLNDGTAFPFVMLGLAVLGLHDAGSFGWRWLAVDLAWAVAAGIAVGWCLGRGVGRHMLRLSSRYQSALELDDFLSLGMIALAYGLALLVAGYGFLAVFAAGLGLRSVEISGSKIETAKAIRSETAPISSGRVTEAVIEFNEYMEDLTELSMVLITGAILALCPVSLSALAVGLLVLFFVRPLAVLPALLLDGATRQESFLVTWFGIRGIGSLYYLMYAVNEGLAVEQAIPLLTATLTTIALSIILHGISVTPLMRLHQRQLH